MNGLENTLQQLHDNLDIIQSTYPDDACLVLTDTEKILYYLPGKQIDLKIQKETRMSNLTETVTYKALHSGKVEKEEKDAKEFGIAYIATATPIEKNGKVIGVLCSVVSNHKLDVFRTEAEELTAVSEELSATSEQMTNVSNTIAKDLQELTDESSFLKTEIQTIESILNKIKDTAVKSRILGLNASIEAARSGEHGKGFMVVANEIKKMADGSKAAVEGFEPQLQEMMFNIEKVLKTIQEISAHSQEQSVMMEEFQTSFDHIVHAASKLNKNACI